jgi:hypothetical protein
METLNQQIYQTRGKFKEKSDRNWNRRRGYGSDMQGRRARRRDWRAKEED